MAEFKEAAEATAATEKIVHLVSQEGESFDVTIVVAQMSNLVKEMLVEDGDSEDIQEIPLPNVKSAILAKVIEYCKHHVEEAMTEFDKPLASENLHELVQEFYANFIDVEQEMLFNLTLAANYLDIKPLLDLCSAKIASYIKNKTPEQIRINFNITNDFTPEEEAQVREENKWADEI